MAELRGVDEDRASADCGGGSGLGPVLESFGNGAWAWWLGCSLGIRSATFDGAEREVGDDEECALILDRAGRTDAMCHRQRFKEQVSRLDLRSGCFE